MTPIFIGGSYGVLHRAAGSYGVIICGSLGDEALNMYRSQMFLAEHLAGAGFPTLRIDYYGTGNSAGKTGRFDDWVASITNAVRWLQTQCHVRRIALCGFRIGAALAASAACASVDIDALIMLSPIANGRRFLREMILAEQTNADIWKSRSSIDDGQWFEAHGMRIDGASRDELGRLDIAKLQLPPGIRLLLLDASGAAKSHDLVKQLSKQGFDITYEIIDGLDSMLRESHESEIPRAAVLRTSEWLGDAGCTRNAYIAEPLATPILELGIARETAVQLGPDEQLAGIFTEPTTRDDSAPVLLVVNTGANPCRGNSRGHVALARWLAECGIACLRIDGAGIGDSAPETGIHGQPYSVQGSEDVTAGVDFLAAHCRGPIIVYGVCSGAYHAFHAALDDARIKGLILVNMQKFIWDGNEALTVVQQTTLRTTRFYLRNLSCRQVWRRLATGRINVSGITHVLAGRALRQSIAALDPLITRLHGETRIGRVRRQVRELAARPVPILYALSGNDPGLDEVAEYFGLHGRGLRRYGNLTFEVIEQADHTLSANWSRNRLQQSIGLYLQRHFSAVSHVTGAYSHRLAKTRHPSSMLAGICR